MTLLGSLGYALLVWDFVLEREKDCPKSHEQARPLSELGSLPSFEKRPGPPGRPYTKNTSAGPMPSPPSGYTKTPPQGWD